MTMNPAEYTVDQLQFFFLALVRIGCMIVVFPILGSRNVAPQVKIGLSFLLALVIVPLLPPVAVALPTQVLPYSILIIKEALVGLTIGYAASLILTAVSMAGAIIDLQVGFAMASAIDPLTGAGSTVMGNFKLTLFTILFLALQGHQFLILAMVSSFEKIPLVQAALPAGKMAEFMAGLITGLFVVSLKLAAPIIVLVMVINAAAGVLARTVPQMNLFVVDLPLRIGVALVGLAVILPVIYIVFEKTYAQFQDDILRLLLLIA